MATGLCVCSGASATVCLAGMLCLCGFLGAILGDLSSADTERGTQRNLICLGRLLVMG